MSRAEVTREAYPLYFRCAEQYPGATVEPFDQYQGPYVLVPGKGRIFGFDDSDRCYRWYNDRTDCQSDGWLGDWSEDNDEAVSSFCDLIDCGGTPVKR